MSKYTTELRFICETESGLTESKGYNDVETIITGAIPKIFNFDFPIFDEAYRGVLERKILKHYYTREISEETYGLWKLRLNTKLNEIMPYYNQLYNSELLVFNPLYTTNLTRTKKTDYESERDTDSTNNTTSQTATTGTGQGATTNSSTDLFSDTPQGAITGLAENTYLTEARIVNESATSSSNTTNNASGNVASTGRGNDDLKSTEDYLETVNGYEGKNASALLKEFRETFLNIDMKVIDELDVLFMQLW